MPYDSDPDKLTISNLTKNYGDFRALDRVSLTVDQGEFLTLLGPSGSGKTTLLMTIAGFIQPNAGTMKLAEADITNMPPEKRSFGMVFQGYALFPHLTVNDNVMFPLKMRRQRGGDADRLVAEALDLVGLSDKGGRYPRELSGGQQQRVALARAIVFRPHMLLLDEPLSALDTQLRGQLQGELKRLHRAVGLTFIYVTHDQSEALSMSDRVAVMKDGRLEQVGAPSELYNAPANRFVAEFMGVENFLPPGLSGGRATLALRSHALGLAEGRGRIAAHVTARNYYGSEIRYTAIAGDGVSLRFNLPVGGVQHFPEEGEAVSLDWKDEDALPINDD